MPRIVLPPTPGSSADITGKDGTKQLDSLQATFVLPEPAMALQSPPSQQRTPTEEMPSPPKPASAYTQPSETVKSRRRSSAAHQPPKDQFALPPPPTRSRKIIQMKPRAAQGEVNSNAKEAVGATKIASSTATGGSPAATPVAGSKRKQPAASTAAGRKMARKTAHSLIERRRRSKMNEEFAQLKSMIPACSGEMHKLAILQASIEYVRYLEDCVAKLKAQRASETGLASTEGDGVGGQPRYIEQPFHPANHSRDQDEDEEEEDDQDGSLPDIEMEDPDIPSPSIPVASHHSQFRPRQPDSISPVLLAQQQQRRHDSRSSSSASTAAGLDYRHQQQQQYDYAVSTASTSPAFGPQAHHQHHRYSLSDAGSALTSPALAPQADRDVDREATAALLMLNQSDRRMTGGSGSAGRGMSVRDLLSP